MVLDLIKLKTTYSFYNALAILCNIIQNSKRFVPLFSFLIDNAERKFISNLIGVCCEKKIDIVEFREYLLCAKNKHNFNITAEMLNANAKFLLENPKYLNVLVEYFPISSYKEALGNNAKLSEEAEELILQFVPGDLSHVKNGFEFLGYNLQTSQTSFVGYEDYLEDNKTNIFEVMKCFISINPKFQEEFLVKALLELKPKELIEIFLSNPSILNLIIEKNLYTKELNHIVVSLHPRLIGQATKDEEFRPRVESKLKNNICNLVYRKLLYIPVNETWLAKLMDSDDCMEEVSLEYRLIELSQYFREKLQILYTDPILLCAFNNYLMKNKEHPNYPYCTKAMAQHQALIEMFYNSEENMLVNAMFNASLIENPSYTISQIKSDERFKSETEGVYGFVHDRDRILKKGDVSFKNGNWYNIVFDFNIMEQMAASKNQR